MVDVATKPVVSNIWANSAVNPADIVAPTQAFIETGWPLSSKPPTRQYFNWLLNWFSNAVRYFSRRGLVDYDPAETYLINDIVRGDDNVIYQSLQSENIGNTPSTSPLFWGPANLYAKTVAELNAGLTIVNAGCPQGDLRRYGVVPNVNTPAQIAINQTALFALVNYAVTPGPVGKVFSVNTTGADIIYFKDICPMRDYLQIDGGGCTWNFTKAARTGNETASGFLMGIRGISIENLKLICNFPSGGGEGAAIYLGARGNDGYYFQQSFDSLMPVPMGQITLRNLYVQSNNPGCPVIAALGGLQGVVIENVSINGQGVCGGLYAEFGWATTGTGTVSAPGPVSTRQTSHPHNWQIRAFKVTDLETSGDFAAIQMNGAYNITIDGFNINGASGIGWFGTGESLFYNPWAGVDDGLVSRRTVTITNVVAKGIVSAAYSLNGASVAQTAPGVPSGYYGWAPDMAVTPGCVTFNGPSIYVCVAGGITQPAGTFTGSINGTALTISGAVTGSPVAIGNAITGAGIPAGITIASGSGTSWVLSGSAGVISSESMTTTQGPTGTSTGINDNGVIWNYVSSAAPYLTDLLSFVVEGSDANQSPANGNYGLTCSGGRLDLRNSRFLEFSIGINTTAECTHVNIDGCEVLDSGGVGIQLGDGFNIWPTPRKLVGGVRNCFIAGSGAVATAPGLIVYNTATFDIRANRFAFELGHDGVAETTQSSAAVVDGSCSGVICSGNYVAGTSAGASAYAHNGATASNGCVIEKAQGLTTTAGYWKTDLQSPTVLALTSGGIIPTNAFKLSRVDPTSSVTGVVLQPGTAPGDEITVLNEASAYSITFAAAATSNVANGASMVIGVVSAARFSWDTATNLWYHNA